MEDINQKYQHLFNTVKKLRHWQKEWEEYHWKSDLEPIKILEKEVDWLIKKGTAEEKNKKLYT